MSEYGTLKLWNALKQQKRALNKANSTKLLELAGINFESKNDGYHLVVQHKEGLIDFYPSTGLWKFRNKSESNRGVKKLLEYLNGQ